MWPLAHTIASVNLILWNDYLRAITVIGAGNRVLEDTYSPDDLVLFYNSYFTPFSSVTRAEVTGVTNDLLGLDSLATTSYTDEFAVRIGNDLIDPLIEHVSAAINGTETSKGLWKLP